MTSEVWYAVYWQFFRLEKRGFGSCEEALCYMYELSVGGMGSNQAIIKPDGEEITTPYKGGDVEKWRALGGFAADPEFW